MCANASQTMNVSPISRTLRALCAPLDRTRLELGEEHLPLEVSSDEDESRSGSPPRRAHPLLGTLAELVGAVYRLERLLVKRPKLALMKGGGNGRVPNGRKAWVCDLPAAARSRRCSAPLWRGRPADARRSHPCSGAPAPRRAYS